ncbi:CCA tRNA nucleotidyltransferase [Chloroflexota bacterium]
MYQQIVEDLKIFVKPCTSLLLTRIGHFLAEEDVESYLVGGFVRDALLGRDTADIDIAVDADALEIASEAAKALGGKYIPLDKSNGVARVVLLDNEATAGGSWELDFSTIKGNIEQDLAKRDFTVDAMAIDIRKIIPEPSAIMPYEKKEEITISPDILIDPFAGWNDLRQSVIRVVSETAFESDAIRLLRAVRLAAELGFSIDSETEELIKQHCHLIAGIAGERVRMELLRLLASPRTGQFLSYLDELGLLTAIIPEMIQAKGVSQPRVHIWDVFEHSIKTVRAAEFLLGQESWQYAGKEVLAAVPWSAELSEHFSQEVSGGSTRKTMLKLSALLHDVAKPQTKFIDEDGRAHFLGHTHEGATIAASILERLRFSVNEIKLAEVMVKNHLRPGQMSNYGLPSRRAIYRYFRDTGEAGIDILFLSLADHLATRGSSLDMAGWQIHTQLVKYVIAQRFEDNSTVMPPKLIDGHDLINAFSLVPGSRIGELLETVREAQAAGEVNTKEEAIACINHLLTNRQQASLNNSR